MSKNSELIANYTINQILISVWDGVANSIISKKLALKSAHLEVYQFATSYMSNATQNKQKYIQMKQDIQPVTIVIDNIAYGQLNKQIKPKQNKDSLRKLSLTQSANQSTSRKFTIEGTQQIKSPQINKINEQTINTNQQLITLPEILDEHFVKDPKQDDCRNLVFRKQKQAIDMKKLLAQRLKQRQQNGSKNKKIIKDLKKYTFDYQGKFFGVGNIEAQHQKMLKLQKQDGQQSISSREIKDPQRKTIQNDKLKAKQSRNKDYDKNAPQFDQNRPESLLDFFAEENKIEQGIKITGDKGNQKLIKQNRRRKLSGIKQYRLNQYQGLTKDKKFIDFRKPIPNYSTTIDIDVNKTTSLNSYNPQTKNLDSLPQKSITNSKQILNSSFNSNSQISLNLKKQKQQTSTLLPPIQSSYLKKNNKIGIKRLSIQQSSRTLNQSGIQSIKSRKSQIKIDHEQLYFQNFTPKNIII